MLETFFYQKISLKYTLSETGDGHRTALSKKIYNILEQVVLFKTEAVNRTRLRCTGPYNLMDPVTSGFTWIVKLLITILKLASVLITQDSSRGCNPHKVHKTGLIGALKKT